MSCSLFVIEHSCSSHLPGWMEELRLPELRIGRRSLWESLVPDQLSSCQEQIVVLNAVPYTDDALKMFHWLQTHPIHVPSLAIIPADNPELLRLAALSVDDFLVSPIQAEEFRQRLMRLVGPISPSLENVQDQLVGELGLHQAIGRAPRFLEALQRVALFGPSLAPVLLTGETGTGKELFARILHMLSKRRRGPFIPVECGAVPEHLFENELFGHVRGAFTDAHAEQRGCVGLAQGGTLFLDEIDCLSMAAQGKLLRLIQENKYRPLGGDHFRDADIRVVAASNRDLPKLVETQRFRADLFFRLDVLRVHLPSLRERPGDIPLLARHFANALCEADGHQKKFLSPASLRKLECHHWPGNIRELQNTIQRAVLTAQTSEITLSQIELRHSGQEECPGPDSFHSAKAAAIEQFQRQFVQRLLERHAGNVTRAAREARQDRRAFGRLVKKYGLKTGLG
jgi:DNA-binding NtrC family response regulator